MVPGQYLAQVHNSPTLAMKNTYPLAESVSGCSIELRLNAIISFFIGPKCSTVTLHKVQHFACLTKMILSGKLHRIPQLGRTTISLARDRLS
jgi:hypothetical protein